MAGAARPEMSRPLSPECLGEAPYETRVVASEAERAALAARLGRETGLPAHCTARLARLYGTEAFEVAKRDPAPLSEDGALVAGEVEWGVAVEGAAHLRDMLYRRTGAALYEPAARDAVVEPIADRMAALLGWSAERRDREVAETRQRLEADLTFADSELSL